MKTISSLRNNIQLLLRISTRKEKENGKADNRKADELYVDFHGYSRLDAKPLKIVRRQNRKLYKVTIDDI